MYGKRTLIIVPVLNDESSLITLIHELSRVLKDQAAVSLLVVDDGSIPPIELVDVPLVGGQILTLSRNLGHQKAIAIGLAYAVAKDLADVFVVMDADGEDRPEDVPRLLAALESGTESGPELSVVVARRMKRHERLAFRAFYQLYRLLFFLLTGHRI